MFKKIIFTLLISFLSCSLLAEEYIHYQVKKKDYLSSILYSLDIAPIYGKKGYLKKVIALNKKKVKKHGDVILEGTDLLLPLSVASKVLAANKYQLNKFKSLRKKLKPKRRLPKQQLNQ
jgi:hypothetical protein